VPTNLPSFSFAGRVQTSKSLRWGQAALCKVRLTTGESSDYVFLFTASVSAGGFVKAVVCPLRLTASVHAPPLTMPDKSKVDGLSATASDRSSSDTTKTPIPVKPTALPTRAIEVPRDVEREAGACRRLNTRYETHPMVQKGDRPISAHVGVFDPQHLWVPTQTSFLPDSTCGMQRGAFISTTQCWNTFLESPFWPRASNSAL
jgi:hypothetical protein